MSENKILPNTFLIGAQKSATTSVYNWLALHPDICAPLSVKDYAFFTREDFFAQGINHLSSFYEGFFNNEKIILQGSVHYIFFEKALKRISEFNPQAKFILILRNPVERAISAYEYALKFNYETLSLKEAFDREEERLMSSEHRVVSELTYKNHGLYNKQIKTFLKYFGKDQIKIVLFEEVSKNPQEVMASLFNFLGVKEIEIEEFRSHNITGSLKNKTIQKIVFGDNEVRNFLVKNIFNRIIPPKYKAKLRWKIIHLNTKKTKKEEIKGLTPEFIKTLNLYYENDIEELEKFLNKDLSHWKN